jgi:hypothetical protein
MSKASIQILEKLQLYEKNIVKILGKRKGGFIPRNEKEIYDRLSEALQKHKQKIDDENMANLSPNDFKDLEIYDKKVDALVGDECIMCGYVFIETLDMPFDSVKEVEWTL